MIISRAAATAAVLVLATGGVAAAAHKDPFTNTHAAPGDDAGRFLGNAVPDFEWHGCKHTSVWVNPDGLPDGAQPIDPGDKQSAVTFKQQGRGVYPLLSWTVNSHYTICGVEAMTELYNKTEDALFYGSTAYTSGRTKGETAKNGRETLKVKVRKNQVDGDQAHFGGKTYTIFAFDAVAVYIKKK